jgi:CheY-like chemotaxis protein
MKILALEDQPVPAMLLSALLKAMGQDAEMVADGGTASIFAAKSASAAATMFISFSSARRKSRRRTAGWRSMRAWMTF